MNTRSKVIIDEWFGRSAVLLLNIAARILGRILSINHTIKSDPQRIVICKFLGMGSIIQATPLLQTLRKNFPHSEIIFVTSRANMKLLESVSVVDKVLCINDNGILNIIGSTFTVLGNLWKKKASLYIDLETYSFYSTALATLSCSVNRFGFYRIERNIRMGVYTHMMFFNSRAPIAQSYLQMARLAGCKTIEEKLYPFTVSENDHSFYSQKFKSLTGNSGKKYIIVNPNASDLRIERRWPKERFAELIHLLLKENPDKIILLIGSLSELKLAKEVYDLLHKDVKDKVFNSAGLFTLGELFALINNSELVITNDTGPMHISFAMNKPTVALFGPASPSQYGQNSNVYGIYKNIYCSPCVHDFLTPPCKGDNQCMKQISVTEVAVLCNKILKAIPVSSEVDIPPMNYLNEDGKTSLGILERGR